MAEAAALDSPYCVGRDAELDSVRALAHDLALGAGSASVWLGESGIGKSRLLHECAQINTSAAVLSLRCGAGRFAPNAAAQTASVLRLAGRSPGTRRGSAVLAALAARSRRKPLVVLIDDMHLATSSERAFVGALLAMAAHHRLVVVGCASPRNEGDDTWRRSGAVLCRLRPLDDSAMELLVRSLAGARALSSANVRDILKTAQGNPRFGIELAARALHFNGEAALVPESARSIVSQARARLSHQDFAIASACSAIGDEFSSDWVAGVAQQPHASVADALQSATDLGLLVESSDSPGWFAFRQIAVRRAIYTSIVAPKRRILHQRIVERLRDAKDGDARANLLLAQHAEIIGDGERAAEAFTRAAERAFEEASFATAGSLYVRAAQHVRRAEAQWIEHHQRALRCFRNAADWRNVAAVALSLLAALDRTSECAAVGDALENLFFAQLNDGDKEGAEATAVKIASLGLPESADRARIATLILAYGYCYTGQMDEAARLVATVRPEHLDVAEVRLRYCIAKAELDALVVPLEQSLALVDEAAQIASRIAIRGTVLAYGSGVEIACRFGDLAAARAYAAHAKAYAGKSTGLLNDVRRRVVSHSMRVAMLEGDLSALREFVRANVGWRPSGRHNEAFDAAMAVHAGMRVGDLALVDAFFDPQLLDDSVSKRDAESCGLLLHGFAEVMNVRGLSKDLRSILERCIARRMIDPYTFIQLSATRFAPLGCAAAALTQAEEYFNGAIAPAADGHVALCRATLLRRQGRHAAAVQSATTAAARFCQIGWRLYQAMALELAGNPRAAGRLYGECGAASDVARLAAGETRKLKYAPFGARLSPREREVADLVAAKRSNRDIARALAISVRTVDHHVEAAFSKLGVRARWELSPEMLERRAH